jgi:ATP-dependent Lon protease
LQEIPDNVKSGLEIVPVRWIDQVLEVALERMPTPLLDDEPVATVLAEVPAPPAKKTGRKASGAIKH